MRMKKKNFGTQQKSVKMTKDDLTEVIKSAVKDALCDEEGKDDGDEGDGEDKDDDEADVSDVSSLVSQALDMVAEKRKARKDAGEELGDITADEILEAIDEIADSDLGEDEKDDDDADGESKDDDSADDEAKGRKSAARPRQTKGRKSAPPVTQRKYSAIYLSKPSASTVGARKSMPPEIQLARAVKCLDVFGRRDPEAAAYYAKKKYADENMARQFKALSATNPETGGYLIPEIYLDQIVEMLYSKTVIFELGAQKVPMPTGNLNIPKMTSGARATWGGEARKIAPSQPTFGSIKLSAKRLEAIVPQTRELLMSTSYSADQLFANDLTRRMELGIDFGGMFGSGNEFQPLGVFRDKDITHLDAKTLNNPDIADTNGKITADFPVFLRSELMSKNVDDAAAGWAMNSMLEGYFMNMKTTTGEYLYRDEMYQGKLLGFNYKVSNQIPTDKNGLTELCFGNWNDLLVGEQLGLETYTTLDGTWVDDNGVQHSAFDENLAATRALMFVDIAARHKESFIHVKNIKVK